MKLFNKSLLFIFLFISGNSLAQSGCTDYQANNFDPLAVVNDGSCTYPATNLPLNLKCYIDSLLLNETSGIVNRDNNFWSHVDDTYNKIYRIDTLSDSILQTVTINNATNIDWEDISSDSNYIYIGDIGNNTHSRTNLRFYRILKTDITDSTTNVDAERINFSYSDQVIFDATHRYYDCEAFFILNDSIHMFTKGWANRWTKHYVLPADTGMQVAQLIDSFNVTCLITSAAIQGDSLVVLIGLNYMGGNNSYVWMFNEFHGSDFFTGNKRRFSIGNAFSSGQVEAICFRDTCKGYITNERNTIGSTTIPARLREFNLYPFLAPAPPAPVIMTTANAVVQNLKACSDSGTATFKIVNKTTFANQDLSFTIGGLPSWVTATPVNDTLIPGDSTEITLTFSSWALFAGAYITNIPIQSNDPYRPIKYVTCTLNVDSNPCMSFSFTSDTCNGIIHFNSSSINTPSNYYWDFGDGDTSAIADPAHKYATNGNYVARLIGCNSVGCDTVLQNIQSINSGPKAAACYPVTQAYCCGSGVTHFQLTGPMGDVINNNSMDASVSFEDFTCPDIVTLITDYPYALNCLTSQTNSENLKVWLDMNNDGILDSVSEELFFDFDTVPPVHSGFITIPVQPTNVYGVPLRMRVASDIQIVPGPCLSPQTGQHEDYSVVLNYFSVGVNEIIHETGFNIYPNPFTQSANIDYLLRQTSDVTLDVFNILGEKIASLVDSQIQFSGQYHFSFNVQSSGIYFVKLTVNGNSAVKRVVKM